MTNNKFKLLSNANGDLSITNISSEFVCSICGQVNLARNEQNIRRELMICQACGSNMRFRAIACAITQALTGSVCILSDLPIDLSIKSIGISDAAQYAQILEQKLSYTNTYLHTKPQLDIENLASFSSYGLLDLIVCSDVLEHTLKPPMRVLVNLAQSIKPGGYLVLSAPSFLMPDHIERYPSLNSYDVEKAADGSYRLIFHTPFSTHGVDNQPVFHGGPGRVLELRIISHPQLLQECELAGFELIWNHVPALSNYGAQWPLIVEQHNGLPLKLDGSVLLARRIG